MRNCKFDTKLLSFTSSSVFVNKFFSQWILQSLRKSRPSFVLRTYITINPARFVRTRSSSRDDAILRPRTQWTRSLPSSWKKSITLSQHHFATSKRQQQQECERIHEKIAKIRLNTDFAKLEQIHAVHAASKATTQWRT